MYLHAICVHAHVHNCALYGGRQQEAIATVIAFLENVGLAATIAIMRLLLAIPVRLGRSTQLHVGIFTSRVILHVNLTHFFAGQQREELLREWLPLALQPLCTPALASLEQQMVSTHCWPLAYCSCAQPSTICR